MVNASSNLKKSEPSRSSRPDTVRPSGRCQQRRRARRVHGIRRGHCGSVTFIQRFGSALNLTPHFHTLVLDGVYAGPTHELGSFLPLPPPETEDVARVLAGAARRILRVLERRDLEADDDPLTSDDPLLALLDAASIRSRIATGPETGRPWQRLGDRGSPRRGSQLDPRGCRPQSLQLLISKGEPPWMERPPMAERGGRHRRPGFDRS